MKKFLLNTKLFVVTFVIALLFLANTANAQKTWDGGAGTNNWGDANNWNPNAVPLATDAVTLINNTTVNVNVAAVAASITFPNTNANDITLNINTGFSLTVGGAITINRGNNGLNTLAVGAGTLTAGSIVFGDAGTNARHFLTISTGTATVTGNITGTGGTGSPTITFTGAGLLKIGGTMFTNAQGTFTPSTGTVEYTAAGAQTVGDFTYYDLTLSGSGAKTVTGVTVNDTLSRQGTCTVTGTPTYGAAAVLEYKGSAAQTVAATEFPTPMSADVVINNASGVSLTAAKTLNGNLTLLSGTFAASTNLTLGTGPFTITRDAGSITGTLGGTAVYDAVYTGNTKTTGIELGTTGLRNVTVSLAAGQTLNLDQNRVPDGNVSVTSGTFDIGTFTIARSAAGGTLGVSNGATLAIGGTNGIPANYSTHTFTGTIDFNGTTQTVPVETYGSLAISGSGTKTLAASTTVATTLTLNAGILSIPATATLTVSSGNPIGGSSFSNTKHIATVETGANVGSLRVNNMANGVAYVFPVGNGSSYLPATITPGSGTVSDNTFTANAFTGITADGTPNGTPIAYGYAVNAVWNITYNGPGAPTAPGTILTLGWDGALEGSGFTPLNNNLIGISHYGGGVWGNYQQTSGDNGANTVTLNNVTSFSPFSVGKVGPASGALPIKISYFNASKGTNVNTLNWNAECSAPYVTFEIERSADGRNFTTINSITASKARCASPFNIDDAAPLAGNSFYRIKMIDIDGSIAYTAIIKVGGVTKDIQITGILPNPVVNTAQLSITTTKKDNVEIAVISLQGQVIAKKTVQLQSGSSLVALDVATLKPGTYFVRGTFGVGDVNTVKFVKQ